MTQESGSISDEPGYAEIKRRGEAAVASKTRPRVLDAGCGRRCFLNFSRDAFVVGLDVGEAELAANERLDERIVGALETYPLPAESFDVAVCQDVLEHLPRPEAALRNLMRAVKPGGLLILGFPNVLTPKGVVTKFTPLWVHLWLYRRLKRNPRVGTEGYGPYKTYLRWCLRPKALSRIAQQNGFAVDDLRLWASDWPTYLRERHAFGYRAWRALEWVWRVLTINRLDPTLTEVWMVLRKIEA